MKNIIKIFFSSTIFFLACIFFKKKINVNKNNRILVIDIDIPKFDRDAGSARMRELLKILVLLDYEVTFISDTFNRDGPYKQDLRSDGIEVISGRIAGLILLMWTKKYFSKIILSRPGISQEYLKYLRKFMPESKIIYDTVDLHWIRLARMANILGSKEKFVESKRIKRIELANIRSADLTLAISQDEKLKILKEIPSAKVEVFPVIYHTSSRRSSFEDSSEILFIGNFSHSPNEDAVLYFINEILPHVVNQIKNIKFNIVGANMPTSIINLKSENINPLGYVDDVSELFKNSRLFVCPLRFGAGIKGKLIQSLAFGLPVVSTSIGIEGIFMRDGENCSVADDAIGFAKKVVELYFNDSMWNLYSTEGIGLVEKYYSSNAHKKNIKSILEK